MRLTRWHYGAMFHPKDIERETRGVLGGMMQCPLIVMDNTHYAYGGLLYAISHARIMRMYDNKNDVLSDVYSAFLDVFMNGLPPQKETYIRIS